jgi:hypothetical protein
MKRIKAIFRKSKWVFVVQLTGCLLSALCSGCATTGYMGDRMRDAGDIFTATVGVGGGAKARVGPVTAGLFLNSDKAGLRGGEVFSSTDEFQRTPRESTSLIPIIHYCVLLFVNDDFRATPEHDARHKSYQAISFIPLVSWVVEPKLDPRAKWPYYTQIEAAAGLGGTIRLGFNPGELVDFILGWTTIDIFNDDLKKPARRDRPSARAASWGDLERDVETNRRG